MTSFPCQAVLFDCDGVLVDSDGPVIAAWSQWAVDLGLDPVQVVSVVHGRRAADTVAMLVPGVGQADALALINRYELEAAHHVEAIPGARALTQTVPAQRWAVVTSGTTTLARARLVAAGIPDPRVLITADDVERGKPEPDGYLAAARLLGVAPGTCAVLEDAAAGIAAARAAGVAYVIGVGDRGLEGLADALVPDLTCVSWVDGALEVPAGGSEI